MPNATNYTTKLHANKDYTEQNRKSSLEEKVKARLFKE